MVLRTVSEILKELNTLEPGSWVVGDGVRAITSVTKNENSYNFNPAEGTLVKSFCNVKTGEVKLFAALLIKDSF